ncbi:MAG: ParB/RepB/Spo0J family partition protein [Butyricicoccus pullicaecorum]|nr:ParB/RepB/Spo0J family partition protein [Butyricicoccus pullicaecorum]
MKSSAKNIVLAAYDDLFVPTEEINTDENHETIQEISLSQLHSFKDHPFKVLDNEDMANLVESIKQYGVLVPVIVRLDPAGGYELIAGHRRHHASKLAGLETIPALVRSLDDDAATIIMVDSNLQRESLLPSERAFAYKMKLDAMKRRAGRPSKENLSQVGTQKRSDELLAEQVGESRNQIQRYIRLTKLVEPLLAMLDEKKIALNSAYKLSFLSKDEQAALIKVIKRTQIMPSLSQTQRLKTFSEDGTLSEAVISAILSKKKADKAEKVTFKTNTLKKYFPDNYTTQDMQETIIALLEKWKEREESHT